MDEHAASECSWSTNISLSVHRHRQEYCARPEYRFCTGESDIQAVWKVDMSSEYRICQLHRSRDEDWWGTATGQHVLAVT